MSCLETQTFGWYKTEKKIVEQTKNRYRQKTWINLRFWLSFVFAICLILSSLCTFAQDLAPRLPEDNSAKPASAINTTVLDNRLDLPLTTTLPSSVQPPAVQPQAIQSRTVQSEADQTPTFPIPETSLQTTPDLNPCPTSGVADSATSDSAVNLDSKSPSNLISRLESPQGAVRSVQFLLIMGAFTLVPALLIMTTSFVRIIVVLSLLRQALGVQNLPPQQVISGLAVFMTLFIMYPTFQEVYQESLVPYQNEQITLEDAWKTGIQPVRHFMSAQIQKAGNDADVWLFWRYAPNAPNGPEAENLTYDDVPTQVLVPAFLVSELKIAFLMGVKFFIPFLIIDFLVASITVSMGIMMLPPAMISLPLKLLLFVMLDGWNLVVESLIQSFF